MFPVRPPEGSPLSSNTQRGPGRQPRTIYSLEQKEDLESFFQNNPYPSYDERESLAARLNLQEQQIQVWFKNRRAKDKKTRQATQQRDQAADAPSQGPGVAVPAPAPVPGPSTAGPGFPEDPVFAWAPGFYGAALAPGLSRDANGPGFSGDATAPGGTASMGDPGVHNPRAPNVFGGVVAAETSTSGRTQLSGNPTQDAQNHVLAAATSAPAAAPVWSADPYIWGFGSDLSEGPTLADLLSSPGFLEGPSSLQSGCPKDEGSGSDDDTAPKFLHL